MGLRAICDVLFRDRTMLVYNALISDHFSSSCTYPNARKEKTRYGADDGDTMSVKDRFSISQVALLFITDDRKELSALLFQSVLFWLPWYGYWTHLSRHYGRSEGKNVAANTSSNQDSVHTILLKPSRYRTKQRGNRSTPTAVLDRTSSLTS